MTRRKFLTKKQKQRLVANSKIRKQTRQWILFKLNNGERYGRGTFFFHASKGEIEKAQQPSRYRGRQGARKV